MAVNRHRGVDACGCAANEADGIVGTNLDVHVVEDRRVVEAGGAGGDGGLRAVGPQRHDRRTLLRGRPSAKEEYRHGCGRRQRPFHHGGPPLSYAAALDPKGRRPAVDLRHRA